MNTCIIYGKTIREAADLHDQLAALLDFPGYYGGNLDALYDVLTDIFDDTMLIVKDADAILTNLGEYGEIFLQLLSDVAEENAHFSWQKQ